PPQHWNPPGHALPQVSQLFSSVSRSVHCELQQSRPCPHALPQVLQLFGSLRVSTHCPAQHCVPSPHGRLQPPQLLLSVRNGKSSSTCPSQSSSRLLQISCVAVGVTQDS